MRRGAASVWIGLVVMSLGTVASLWGAMQLGVRTGWMLAVCVLPVLVVIGLITSRYAAPHPVWGRSVSLYFALLVLIATCGLLGVIALAHSDTSSGLALLVPAVLGAVALAGRTVWLRTHPASTGQRERDGGGA